MIWYFCKHHGHLQEGKSLWTATFWGITLVYQCDLRHCLPSMSYEAKWVTFNYFVFLSSKNHMWKVLLFDVSSILLSLHRNIEINITDYRHFAPAYLLGITRPTFTQSTAREPSMYTHIKYILLNHAIHSVLCMRNPYKSLYEFLQKKYPKRYKKF